MTLLAFSQGTPPPPPAPPGPLTEQRISSRLIEVRRHLSKIEVQNGDSEELAAAARRALNSGEQKLRSKELWTADRFAAGADAFVHALEHPSHLAEGPKGPVPSNPAVSDHLQRVYFHLQQAEFFAGRIPGGSEKSLPEIARNYYERSRKAYDDGNYFAAEEYAKSADDTVRGLENLAQAAEPERPRPPGPR